ncbi:glutamate racemase [Myroides sp. LJL119]
MLKNNPIGLFDSGIGGTTIWREVNQLMPLESTVFLGDQKNAPYGLKTKQEIINLCFKNIDFLIQQDCKIIVIACNTATTNAISEMREHYRIPIIGIEPAIKPATILTKNSKIGILATKGTITSDFYSAKIKQYPHVEIIEQIGYNLVTLIESGLINSEQMMEHLKDYLLPMVDKGIDTLVLGCTHYPYLIPLIKQIIPDHIKIIDSGKAVALQTKNILDQHNLLKVQLTKPSYKFYSNVDPKILASFITESAEIQYKDF